jgi:hypothetical protein
VAKFQKGHKKLGGRRPGGSKAQINLRNAILAALQALDGVEYLIRVAKDDPKTFCALLGRVLPLTIAGDAASPIKYEVTLTFGQSAEDVPAQIALAATGDTTIGDEIVDRAALPSPNSRTQH